MVWNSGKPSRLQRRVLKNSEKETNVFEINFHDLTCFYFFGKETRRGRQSTDSVTGIVWCVSILGLSVSSSKRVSFSGASSRSV